MKTRNMLSCFALASCLSVASFGDESPLPEVYYLCGPHKYAVGSTYCDVGSDCDHPALTTYWVFEKGKRVKLKKIKASKHDVSNRLELTYKNEKLYASNSSLFLDSLQREPCKELSFDEAQ